MALGRLAWRSPTGAILWEIWGRRRWSFLWHAAALLAAVLCVQWKQHGASETAAMLLNLIAPNLFMTSFLAFLAWFGYMEIDIQKLQFSFPSRLMLKPVSTARLTLTPMLFGGAAVVTQLFLWDRLVLEPMTHPSASDILYLAGVILSFFWWMQAVAWSAPVKEGQTLLLLGVGVVHLVVWSLPRMSGVVSPGWRWLIVAGLMVSSVPVALAGQKWNRCGTWAGPSFFSALWRARATGQCRLLRRRFDSPWQAQFWFEWRRYGWALPGLVAAIDFVILPCMKYMMAGLGQKGDFQLAAVVILLVAPVMIAGVFGIGVGDFDVTQPAGGLPVYITARPMTNGGFVLAKLGMSLASSVVTVLVTLGGALFWLTGQDGVLSKAISATPSGGWGLAAGCLPLLLFLTILTWKNLLGGMAARLTGRAWVVGVLIAGSIAFFFALIGLVFAARADWNFQETLLRWTPLVLIAWLALKIVVAAAAFASGLRRNAVTRGVTIWIVATWLACGAFAVGYVWLVCRVIDKPVPWLWITPMAFLIFPVSDLAIAPSAMRWNRHR